MQERVEHVAAVMARAGATVREVEPLPDEALLAEGQALIMAAEAARTFETLRGTAAARLSPQLRTLLDRGAIASADDLRAARVRAARARPRPPPCSVRSTCC